MLKVTHMQELDVFRITPEGDLAMETVDQFNDVVGHSSPATRRIELDCRSLAFVDSTGVNALLQAVLQWRKAQFEVRVTNLSEEIREMLEILGFFEVLCQQQ